jgi:hypothetical protein
MYANGTGVEQDTTEALHWYRRAAAGGIALAQHSLGVLYSSGSGVAQDDARAYMWLAIAETGLEGDDAQRVTTLRTVVSDRLTFAQWNEAHTAATACLTSNFQTCGEPED